MKAYNSPTDELHIESNSGEELVKITPNETKIKNMDLSSLGIESTPEEIDEAVAKADTIPDVTTENSGDFLRVNGDGKIKPETYPYKEVTTVLYNGSVNAIIEEGQEAYITQLAEYDGTIQQFSLANVVINNETLNFNIELEAFTNNDESVRVGLSEGNILFGTIVSGTYSVNIYTSSEQIDNDFKNAVNEIVSLPPITAEDDGDMLTANNGNWVKKSYYLKAINKQSGGYMSQLALIRQGRIVLIVSSSFPIELLNTIEIPEGYRPDGDQVNFMIIKTDGTNIAKISFDRAFNTFVPNDNTLTGNYALDISYSTTPAYPST